MTRMQEEDDFGARAFEELLRRQALRRPPTAWKDAILAEALPGFKACRKPPRFGARGNRQWRWFPRPIVATITVLWVAAGLMAWDTGRLDEASAKTHVRPPIAEGPAGGWARMATHVTMLREALESDATRASEGP